MTERVSMHKSPYLLLPFGIAAVSVALLVGTRLEARFAGGAGSLPHAHAVLVEARSGNTGEVINASSEDVARGALLKTDAGEWKKYTLSTNGKTSTLFLDEKTSLKLVSSNSDIPAFEIIEGRAVVNGDMVTSVRNTKVHSNGTTALTFYSWLDKLDVSATSGTVDVMNDNANVSLTSSSFKLDTLPPFEAPIDFTFIPATSSEAAFYAWALGTNK
jgi:hypothetical protein